MSKTGKEVATAPEAAVPAVYDYGEDSDAGFEGTTGADLSIPFLNLLQGLSPQVVDKNPAGAEAGMLYNTVTHELVDGEKGVVFQPCHRELAYVEWVPLEKGGGFVGLHDPNGDVVKQALEDIDGDKFNNKMKVGENDLVETYYWYGFILDEAGVEQQGYAVIAFTSTKLKKQKDWFSALHGVRMSGKRPAMFANRARIKTIRQKNAKGTFYNFMIEPFGGSDWRSSLIPLDNRALIVAGKDFREMVTSGAARAAFDTQRTTGEDAAGDGADSEAPPF